MPKIILFTEEYIKVTKGLFNVVTTNAIEASKSVEVILLFNQEHWGIEEAKESTRANPRVSVHSLRFSTPGFLIQKKIGRDSRWVSRFSLITNFIFSPLIVGLLTYQINKLKVDAIFSHSGGWPAGQLCRWVMLAAWIANIKKRVFTIHSHPSKNFVAGCKVFKIIHSFLVEKTSTHIVTVSDSVKKVLEEDIFKKNIIRIFNGISPDIKSTRVELGWKKTNYTIGFLGAIYEHKGPQVLLEAFSKIKIESELVFLGPADKNLLIRLKEKASNISNVVTFIEPQDDATGFLMEMDVLVVPSIAFESFGLVILEAMRLKKPVICSDFGGMKEIVIQRETGIIVKANDSEELAKALEEMIQNPETGKLMGISGYKRFKTLFSAKDMSDQYLSLIK